MNKTYIFGMYIKMKPLFGNMYSSGIDIFFV